jgi:nucleotide-binding universal stress UspA family protein
MNINTLVVAISGDRGSDELSCRVAADIARSTGATLHLVHSWNWAVPPLVGSPGYRAEAVDAASLRRNAEELMKKVRVEADGILGRRTVAHVEEGWPEDVIGRVAADVNADLVVVRGNVRHGTFGTFVGSVSEAVLHRATCPVLLVHGDVQWPPREVVACYDGSSEAERALDLAAFLASAMALPLRSARVVSGAHRPHLGLEDRPHSGPVPRPEILHGPHPAAELERFLGKRPPALVAMGTRSKGALPMTHIGSVATHLLRTTSAVMLIVPPAAVPSAVNASASR